MSSFRRDWFFSLVIFIVCVALLFIDISSIPQAQTGIHARGKVVAVDNSHMRQNLLVRTEDQFVTVKLMDGPQKGETLDLVNMLTGKMEMDEFYEAGDSILVEYQLVDGKPAHGLSRGHYRLHLQLVLVVLFALLLLVVMGPAGLKAILSFAFSALVLWKLFFPLLLRGYEPIPTGLVVVALLTSVITFSVGGLNRRGVATFLGSMLGIALTCVLAIVFSHSFMLNGAIRPFAETLLYSGFYWLKLNDIFIASIFIACSGAVMDLAMDISASMDEIKAKHPQITLREHISSGLRVGRAVVGTMTTTLMLAYSSSHLTMFLLFMAKGLPPENIFNASFVSAEILNILVGSFGLVTVAPFTAVIAGFLYRGRVEILESVPELEKNPAEANLPISLNV